MKNLVIATLLFTHLLSLSALAAEVKLAKSYSFTPPKVVEPKDPYLGFKPETDPNKQQLEMYSDASKNSKQSGPLYSAKNTQQAENDRRTYEYQKQTVLRGR